MPKKITKKIHEKVGKRAKGYCEYCKCLNEFASDSFETEHIIPRVLGGSDNLDNLAKSCGYCNGAKHTAIKALDPKTNQIVRLFHPRKDSWSDHFEWSADFLTMIGKTAIGRATIIRLNTNRIQRINLRKVTLGYGHPPPVEN